MAARKAGVITINLNAGTAQFVADMDKAQAKIGQFGRASAAAGHSAVTGVQATSGALRVLEGGLNNNLRAAERFTANVLGLGPILQAAFPLIGGLAFLGLLGKLGSEVKKFYTDLRDAPEKMAGAWRDLQAPIKLSNDEMAVSVDRINNEIAKLQGIRQNTLKLALDEAKVSADHLTDSLTKAFREFSKFLEENQVGAFRQFLGEGSTYDVRMMAGGFTGTAGIQTKIEKARMEGDLLLAKAKTPQELASAETERDIKLHKVLNDELADANRLIGEYRKRAETKTETVVGKGGAEFTRVTPGTDMTTAISQMQKYIDVLNEKNRQINLTAELAEATRKRDAAQANRDNAKLDRPFETKVESLKAELAGINTRIGAIGGTQAEKVVAESFAEAERAIAEIDKGLTRINPKLHISAEQAQVVRDKFQAIGAAKETLAWGEKLDATSKKILDQVKAEEMLTAAIGKGYEAVKKVSIETAVMKEVGPERYNDSTMKPALDRLRAAAGQSYDAEHARVTASAVDRLETQIELEKSLAAVQEQGAEAVRVTALAYRLREIQINGVRTETGALSEATRKQIAAEIALFNAQRANAAANALAGIGERVEGVKRLNAAVLQGAEAERKAALENKYAEMRRAGAPEAVVTAERGLDEAEHQQKVRAEAVRTGLAYQNNLESIKQQVDELDRVEEVTGKTFATEVSRRNLENERLRVLREQYTVLRDQRDATLRTMADLSIQMGGARDGVRAFFLEMQTQAKKASAIIEESLNSALDRTSDNLAKLLTGQKTAWGQMFQQIGEGLVKDTIKSSLQQGLGALGKKFGVDIGKPDGSRTNPLWIRDAALGGTLPAGSTGGTFGAGDQGGGIFSVFRRLLGRPAERPITFGNGGLLGTGQVPKVAIEKSPVPVGTSTGIGKPDGTPLNPFYVVMSRFGSEGNAARDFLRDAGSGAALAGGFGGGGVPARAAGGPVSAGSAYLVGERGAEIFRPAMAGVISSNAESQRMLSGGGDSHYYSIDARGTDPVLVEQRVRAGITAAHNGAIQKSVLVSQDRLRRMPGKQ